MALPNPREGEILEFHSRPCVSYETTIGDPEHLVWASIKHLTVEDVADRVLENSHKITSVRERDKIIKNLKLYIDQAQEFYEAARIAKATTAPLFYYYSFLNLGKALCEIRYPRFHQMRESYNHGISWRPNPQFTVSMHSDSVRLVGRGVWHILYEAVTRQECRLPNPSTIRIVDLFSLNAETETEYEMIFDRPTKLIELHEPKVLVNSDETEIWLRFSLWRENLKQLRITRPTFLKFITSPGATYHYVRSTDSDLWTFEHAKTIKVPTAHEGAMEEIVEPAIRAMNLFVSLTPDELQYAVPVQAHLPVRLPQVMVLYSLLFWLGSLVRYDPHSVARLQEEEHWLLIDGFMNQSRRWLLELFEWELYQCETTLQSIR